MAYSTLATQADTPTAGPDSTYFAAVAANFTALRDAFGARISHAAAQSTLGGTSVYQVLLGTVDWDSSPTLTGTANRLTIPTAWGGVWFIAPCMICAANGSGAGASVQMIVRKNGATDLWEEVYGFGGVGAFAVPFTTPFTAQLVATDYLEVYVNMVNTPTFGVTIPKLREDLGVSLSAVWLSP